MILLFDYIGYKRLSENKRFPNHRWYSDATWVEMGEGSPLNRVINRIVWLKMVFFMITCKTIQWLWYYKKSAVSINICRQYPFLRLIILTKNNTMIMEKGNITMQIKEMANFIMHVLVEFIFSDRYMYIFWFKLECNNYKTAWWSHLYIYIQIYMLLCYILDVYLSFCLFAQNC